jgi:hypothetical protein
VPFAAQSGSDQQGSTFERSAASPFLLLAKEATTRTNTSEQFDRSLDAAAHGEPVEEAKSLLSARDEVITMVPEFNRRRRILALSLSIAAVVGCDGSGHPGMRPTGNGGNAPGGSGDDPSSGPGLGMTVDVNAPIVGLPAPSSRLFRLNSKQWGNSVQALLYLPMPLGYSSAFSKESLKTSFDTNGSVLQVDGNQRSGYQRAALQVAALVARDAKLLAQVAPAAGDPATRAGNFVKTFGGRAYRRPLGEMEINRYLELFNKGAALIASGDVFADGVEIVLRALFQSPHFLYRIETSDRVLQGKIPLGDYEIATRLSYSLTNSTPDDALLTAAAAKMLSSRYQLGEQAKRLLESPAGQAVVSDFHYQLLRLDNDDQIAKNPQQAPPFFTADLNPALKGETLAFVKDVVYGQSKGVAELLTAPYTFADSRVAKIYGVTAPAPAAGQPDPCVRIALDPGQRAGVLTQAGFLSFYGDDRTPNLIVRGARIAQDVLCVDIPQPPASVPPLPDLQPNSTNRKRVEELTKNAPCNACHTALINPLGFAFENLDGFAQFQTQENGQPIDASGTYTIDGKEVTFNGAVALMKIIAQSRQAHDCYARHLAEYLYGREVNTSDDADRILIAQAGAHAKADPSAKDLILKLVTAEAFLNRAPEGEGP